MRQETVELQGRGAEAAQPPLSKGPIIGGNRIIGGVLHRRKSMDSGHSTVGLSDDEEDTPLRSASSPTNCLSLTPSLRSRMVAAGDGEFTPSSTVSSKTVRFDQICIREYATILSDKLGTSDGPPVGLGWDYDAEGTTQSDIDSYEAARDALGPRLAVHALHMTPVERVRILLRCGYAPMEIQLAINRVQREYRRSVAAQYSYGKCGMLFVQGIQRLKNGVKCISKTGNSWMSRKDSLEFCYAPEEEE